MASQALAEHPDSERVVVFALTGRDADVTRKLLDGAGLECVVARDWRQVDELIRGGAGALIVTDATLSEPGCAAVLRELDAQPAWSNLPVLALCRQGQEVPVLRQARLGNLTVLDRPASMRTVVSAVQTALRGRRWQYQIRDQMESLRVADQRKDEFLATLAHELRNPLAPIRTGLQLLARLPEDEQQRSEVTAMMERQMSQLLRLIDDLLEVSRISTGKLVLQRERLDLRRVVDIALEACAPLIASGGHRLAVTLPDEAIWVDGDPTRLAQSLSNLVNNAAKYTPDGGSIAVTLARSGEQAELAVQDSGVGLPPDMIGRVFDMFAQVNRTLGRSQGGLGIGLALVQRLVRLHGGEVGAESAGPDQGSRFTIRLPLAEAPAAAVQAAAAAPAQAQPRRVLVVDDNEDAAESMAMLLSLLGHEVRMEHDGPAALAAAAEFLPQAVFCDVGMPGMDGFEVATRLRQDPRLAATLLVALTGWGSQDDKKRSRAAGFDAHLTKPASLDAIVALMASPAQARMAR